MMKVPHTLRQTAVESSQSHFKASALWLLVYPSFNVSDAYSYNQDTGI